MGGSRAYVPAALPPATESAVLHALRDAHADQPFLPTDARGAAHRVAGIAADLGLEARVLRGSLELCGAELDHLFAVVDDHVLDAAMPVNDDRFVELVRAWVAGDVGRSALAEAAAALDVRSRVVGLFPESLRYRGAPLWGAVA